MIVRKQNAYLAWLGSRIGLQILSLSLAIVAWIFVNSGQEVEQKRSIKLQYVQRPNGLVFQQTPLREVRVDLLGSMYRLRSIRDDDLVYLVDLAHSRQGPNRVDIDLDHIRLPFEVEARHLEPRAFNVYLEEIFVRSLPLKVIPRGALKSGFSLIQMRTRPDTVSVSGPKSVVSKLDNIEIDVDLTNRDAPFEFSIKPELNLPDTEVLDTIQISAEVGPLKFTRELNQVPVELLQAGSEDRISPQTATLVIEGLERDADRVDGRIKVVVSSQGLKKGSYRLRGRVDLPPGLKLVSMDPQNFIVEVVK